MKSHDLVKAADCDNKDSIAGILKSSLESLNDLKHVGDVRGMGLLRGVEFVEAKASKRPFPPGENFAARVGQACSDRGLLVYPVQGCVDGTSGDHLLLAPPAVITEAEISWAVLLLREAILEVI
jgi:adenosylmethionine-8-amino-7-oxononanoate aminotransferase